MMTKKLLIVLHIVPRLEGSELNLQHVRCAMNIKTAHQRSKLEQFSMRLNQYYLALDLEKVRNGRLRNDPAVIKAILKRCGWTKSTLKYHRG